MARHCNWQPGECPNPGGRPKGAINAGKRLRNALEAQVVEYGNAEDIARIVIRKAIQGHYKFCELIFERIIGKARQEIQVATAAAFKAYIGFDPSAPAEEPCDRVGARTEPSPPPSQSNSEPSGGPG